MLKVNVNNKYECAICHGVYDTVRTLSLHISLNHKRDTHEYYDEYCKDPGEGVCKVCGAPTRYRSFGDGYKPTCSHKCGSILLKNDPEKMAAKKAKTVATCMERYGVTNAGGTKESLEKAQQTHLAKHGVRWAMQSKEVVEKSKQTCLDRYGATTYVHSTEGTARVEATVAEKFGRTNFFSGAEGNKAARDGYMAKHGYDHNMHDPQFLEKWKGEQKAKYDGKFYVETDEFKDKSRATQEEEYGMWYSASEEGRRRYREIMLDRHGVPEYFQSDEFKDKSRTTCLEKYGVENISQTPGWKDKVVATNMERYGAPHFTQSPAYKNDAIERYNQMMRPYDCKVVNMENKRRITYHCNKCNSDCTEQYLLIAWRIAHSITPCTVCFSKNASVSAEELELRRYLESLGYPVAHYDRDFLGSYGADMVIEDRRVIVEYDGIYWHSELYKYSGYHLEKKLLAEEKGYRLVHVFSDEWKYKCDIVKSRLAYLLGANTCRKIYARDCTVAEVGSADATKFLDENHIQGAVNSKWRYGLYENGILVSLMTFGPSRFDDTTEMLRFCSDRNLNVIGAAGKLFSHFIESRPEVNVMTSYADARWSTGHAFYEKLGFTLEAMSSRGYYIVDGDIRRNRMQFQRHKIAGPGDEGKTEHEITLERGLFRIYDCGQYRYVWKRGE